ncbi:TetR family transcriptional regulator [Pelagicoccus mobilis]|uniref:TetR family transcriptional regulator n=1 Tax=Pelagicoccus mobilis TaxID=415221 RepID=A0A934RZC8_9BACT|nr:TetR family transcriptional regulator [Pelagicoccus mobilis]MBK1878099.1 TetR family transcriptional regulator [Pelagicoccus mobilis]
MNKTQIKLIEAAEREFADRGFHGASVRDITTRAGTNVASINYHFGSKEELFLAMIRHRIEPINQERFELLEAALQEANGTPLEVRSLVEILIRPLVNSFSRGTNRKSFMRAMGRGMSEETQFTSILYKDVLGKLIKTFRYEFGRSMSDHPEELVDHCFAFLGSSISGVMHHRQKADNGHMRINFPDADHLINFVTGGIEAVVAATRP